MGQHPVDMPATDATGRWPALRLLLPVLAMALLAACNGDGGGASPSPGADETEAAATDGATEPAETEDEGAAGYPDRPITIVVPFSAGGPTDTVTRLLQEPMGEALGQEIIVTNVEGAGGTVAAGEVAAAEPDGYTVLMHHIGMSTAPALYADLGYDPLEDFETIGLVTEVPMTIIANNEFPPNTLEELVTYVQENEAAVTYGHAGRGAASHLCGLLFQSAIGVTVTEVPYEGTGPALTALVAGEVDFLCDQTTNTTGHIQGNQVKAYAVTTPERVETLPDLPTTEEAGLPEVTVGVWHGLYVPAGTPEGIVQALTEALQAALEDENVIDTLAELGATPMPPEQATPEAHRERLESQIELWAEVIAAAGVEPQ